MFSMDMIAAQIKKPYPQQQWQFIGTQNMNQTNGVLLIASVYIWEFEVHL